MAIDELPKFFPGARLNFAENILDEKWEGLAVINMSETNMLQPDEYSWKDLRQFVRLYADALRSSGIRKGDVVARKQY